MSTQQKRTPRPIKPKTVAAPVEPVVAAPVVVPTPAPVPESVPLPITPPDEAPTPATANKRQQTSKAIGVSISSARTRRHLDRLNLNATLDGMINELKEQYNAYKSAKAHLESGKLTYSEEKEVDGKKVFEEKTRALTDAERAAFQATFNKLADSAALLEMKIAALSRERTRFSNEASIALSIICDELVQQLTEHTMNCVLKAKKKIIQINHLHEAGVEKLPLYPLIKSLPSFVAMAESLSSKAQEETNAATLTAALAQAEKDFKKKYSVHAPKKKKAVDEVAVDASAVKPVSPAKVEEAEDDDSADSKTSFRFYVGMVCKEVIKRDVNYESVRVSTEIRGYLSDLLIEFIQRISSLVQLTAACMKNKTINDVAILRTVEALLIDGHAPHETVEFKEALVHDPVVLKAETAKREEEKKAGREYKIDLEKIPKIQGLVAVRAISYPTSGFAALAAKVQEKLALHEELVKKGKVEPETDA